MGIHHWDIIGIEQTYYDRWFMIVYGHPSHPILLLGITYLRDYAGMLPQGKWFDDHQATWVCNPTFDAQSIWK